MTEAPQEVWIGIRGVNTHKTDQGDERYIRHDASPEVVATMPGAQAMVAAAYEAVARLPKRMEKLGGQSYAYVRVEEILALTPADALAALDRLIAEAVAAELERMLHQINEATDPGFIWGALDNVHDAETTLDDYADAVSRAQRAAIREPRT